MEKIKFNRGPKNGQRAVVEGFNYKIEVMKAPALVDVFSAKEFGDVDPIYQRGSYQKSNRRLKDGTWVYEWMGWYE